MELSDLDVEFDEYDNATKDGQPVTGDVYERDADGTLISVTGYQDGVRHGWQRQYYLHGQVEYEGRAERGILVGPHRYYYPDGTLRAEDYWADGRVISSREWAPDRTLKVVRGTPPKDDQAVKPE